MRDHFGKYMHYCIFVAIFLSSLVITSCHKDPLQADITGINLTIDIDRFETELFNADPSELESHISAWEKEYGIFLDHYNYIVGLGSTSDPDYTDNLRSFVTDHMNYRIYERTLEVFPDLTAITADLTLAFKRFRYFFPEYDLPRIITYVSGFNQTAISDEGLLAIGLDKYLGATEAFYEEIGVYQYLVQNMHPQKIVSDCMLFWAETEFVFNDSVNNLISNMIYRGKLMFLVDNLLPAQPDTIKWGFTNDNMNFCINNENQMWTYLISNKLLFNTDRFTINKFILEGPFTNDFSRESPSRAAIWIGYRIVQNYMKKNPDLSMIDLMSEDNYMKILNLSAYNP